MIKTVECVDCGYITDIETTSETNPSICPECGGALRDAYTGETDKYAIAILRQAYNPDLQGIEAVRFVMEDGGQEIKLYDNLDEARAAVEALDAATYHTQNNESGRPEYLIVDENVAEYILSGRGGDLGNYDWEFKCDNPDEDGNHCGECTACVRGMIQEDKDFIRANRVE